MSRLVFLDKINFCDKNISTFFQSWKGYLFFVTLTFLEKNLLNFEKLIADGTHWELHCVIFHDWNEIKIWMLWKILQIFSKSELWWNRSLTFFIGIVCRLYTSDSVRSWSVSGLSSFWAIWSIRSPWKIFLNDFSMSCCQNMFIFGIFKLYTSNISYYNLYQRKLKAITRKKYDIHFLIRTLEFLGRDSWRFYSSLWIPRENSRSRIKKNERHTSSA